MIMSVSLSVSIVIYKNYDDAFKAVETIERFTDTEITKAVYLVDNSCASAEESDSFARRVADFGDVFYINTNENLGFGKGHNFVLEMLNSEYHAIVNPDIILKDDAFSEIIGFMKSTSAGMCIPRLTDEGGKLQPIYRREITVTDMSIRMFAKKLFKKRQEYHTMQDCNYTKPFRVPFGQGSFLVIKTELFKRLNGFDERYFMYMEDADLCKRVNEVSELVYCPYAEVIHKWEKGSHKSFRLMKIHIESMLAYFNKWGWKWK